MILFWLKYEQNGYEVIILIKQTVISVTDEVFNQIYM